RTRGDLSSRALLAPPWRTSLPSGRRSVGDGCGGRLAGQATEWHPILPPELRRVLRCTNRDPCRCFREAPSNRARLAHPPPHASAQILVIRGAPRPPSPSSVRRGS